MTAAESRRLVLDASTTLAWLLDESHPSADAALQLVALRGVEAPRLWTYEVRNGLLMALRRGRISPSSMSQGLAALVALPVTIDDAPDFARAMDAAQTHGLAFYDALYLELTLRKQGALATLDRRLATAAEAENVLFEA